jgi:hypothetical protein
MYRFDTKPFAWQDYRIGVVIFCFFKAQIGTKFLRHFAKFEKQKKDKRSSQNGKVASLQILIIDIRQFWLCSLIWFRHQFLFESRVRMNREI